MKKLTATPSMLLMMFMAFAIVTTTGCKGKKEVEEPKPAGEVLINEYCSGAKYMSDSEAFRASATGESMSRETAKKIARSNAESRLARSIGVTIQVVTDNYVNSTKFNNKEEATNTFNELARATIDEELRGAVVICEELTQKPDQNYVSYIAIELSGDELARAYSERLSNDERIKAEYNYEKFKETFEKEMERIGNEQ